MAQGPKIWKPPLVYGGYVYGGGIYGGYVYGGGMYGGFTYSPAEWLSKSRGNADLHMFTFFVLTQKECGRLQCTHIKGNHFLHIP